MTRHGMIPMLLLLNFSLTGCVTHTRQGAETSALPVPAWAGGAHLTSDERAELRALRPLYDMLRQVERHRAAGDSDKAYLLARALVAQHPDFEPAIPHYLELAADTDHLDEAVTRFTRRVETNRNDAPAWFALALMRDGEGQMAYGKQAIEAGCASWACYLTLATAFAQADRVAEGLEWFGAWRRSNANQVDRVVNAQLAESELLRYGTAAPDQVEQRLLNVVSIARAGHGWEVGLERLGMLYASVGRLLGAREALNLAFAVQEAAGNWEGQLSVLFNQVLLERKANALKVAAGLAAQGRDLAVRCGDLWYQARFLGLLGDLSLVLNEPQAAIDSYEPEVVLDRKIGYLARLPIAWAHLGLAYRATGREEDAVAALHKARRLFDAQGQAKGVAWVDGLLDP